MTTITACGTPRPAKGWRLARWWAARRARAACRNSLAELPDHLRADVGLDGGLPLAHHVNGGRVFVIDGRPNSALSGWHF